MTASSQLLKLAAGALDNGEDPFGEGFLSRHDVTADQCFSLAQQLAIGARLVAWGLEYPKGPQGIAMLATMAETAFERET